MEKSRAEIHSNTRKIERESGKQKLERIDLDKSNYLHLYWREALGEGAGSGSYRQSETGVLCCE